MGNTVSVPSRARSTWAGRFVRIISALLCITLMGSRPLEETPAAFSDAATPDYATVYTEPTTPISAQATDDGTAEAADTTQPDTEPERAFAESGLVVLGLMLALSSAILLRRRFMAP